MMAPSWCQVFFYSFPKHAENEQDDNWTVVHERMKPFLKYEVTHCTGKRVHRWNAVLTVCVFTQHGLLIVFTSSPLLHRSAYTYRGTTMMHVIITKHQLQMELPGVLRYFHGICVFQCVIHCLQSDMNGTVR